MGILCWLILLQNIPLRFVKRHFEKNNNTATLLVPAGRTWPVKCSVAKTDVKFSRGWRNFVVDNRLEVGDVCASEMIKCTGTLLKVVIFRKNEGEGACCSGSSIWSVGVTGLFLRSREIEFVLLTRSVVKKKKIRLTHFRIATLIDPLFCFSMASLTI